jgi:hypothetical protein
MIDRRVFDSPMRRTCIGLLFTFLALALFFFPSASAFMRAYSSPTPMQ